MQRRSFETSNWFLMGLILALAVVGCAAVKVAMAGPPEAPSAALYAVTWTSAGLNTTQNTTAYTVQNYAYHDLFCSVDFVDATQSITITVQSSPDNTTFYDTYQYTPKITDTAWYTRHVSYGRYERLRYHVNTTKIVTPACKSVFFNNWSIPAYAVQKQAGSGG